MQTVPFALTAIDLREEIDDFTQIQKPIGAMSYRELREYVSAARGRGLPGEEVHGRALLEARLPAREPDHGAGGDPVLAAGAARRAASSASRLAIAIMAGYLVVHYVALAFARADLLPPLLAAWTANVIFLGLGVSLFLRART